MSFKKGVLPEHRSGITTPSYGIGYIVVPPDFDQNSRDRFIENCLRRERVSILLERGAGIVHDCYITKEVLKNITFPSKFGETGSTVAYILDKMHNVPMIIGSFSNENNSDLLTEYEKRLESSFENNRAGVTVKGDKGRIVIDVDSNDSDGGEIYIVVKNKERKGKLRIETMGSTEIYSSDELQVKSSSRVTVNTKDPSSGEESNFQIDPELIKFNDGSNEGLININDLVNELNGLVDKVNELYDLLAGNPVGIPPTPWVPVPTDGGLALQVIAKTLTQADEFNKEDFEDDKIVH
jgi:hypothetical protein